MKHIIFLIAALLVCRLPCSAGPDRENAELVDSLEYYLDNLPAAHAARAEHLNSLKEEYRKMPRGEKRIRLAEKISSEYLVDSLDCAIMYINLALDESRQSGNKKLVDHLRLKIISLLPSIGIEIEAKELFDRYDPSCMPRDERYDYWLCATQLYHTISETYPEGTYKDNYHKLTISAIDSLKNYYPADSPVIPYLMGRKYFLEGDNNLAAANFVDAMPELKRHPELLDFAYYSIANHYKDRTGDRSRYFNYLLKRACNTLNRGLIRPQTLADLGEELYRNGYTTLAERCLRLAMQNRENSYQRPTTSFNRTKYLKYLNRNREKIQTATTVLAVVAFAAAIVFVIFALRCRRLLKKKDEELRAKNRQLDTLVDETIRVNRNLTDLTFLSLDQLRDFNVHVFRKLKAGQVKDLYDDIDSGKYQNRLHERFFEVFDSSFLSAFPAFPEKLNQLFTPGKELSLLPDNRLTPELRIAALIRLGVADSSLLSKALNLSLNTIYTYRNRLRNRAVDRDSFEKNLLKIF